ncbi:hypothetical protein GOODEAATRI_008026 [Goodea atripinnis]|uniref:Uncharacterized protein n=1 Tax=Goodea atripinnis TaxID=208336 RepID=A0ABV0MQ93_9TELE
MTGCLMKQQEIVTEGLHPNAVHGLHVFFLTKKGNDERSFLLSEVCVACPDQITFCSKKENVLPFTIGHFDTFHLLSPQHTTFNLSVQNKVRRNNVLLCHLVHNLSR